MSNPIPSQIALATITNGTLADGSVVQSNDAAIQSALNQVIAALSGGSVGQFLQAVDGSDVQWGSAADKASAAAQVFAGAVSTGPASASFTGSQVNGAFLGTDGSLTSFNSAPHVAFQTGLTTDTTPEFQINNAGLMQWAAAGGGVDTILSRISSGSLQLGTGAVPGLLQLMNAAAGNSVLSGIVNGDANARLLMTSGGTFFWGPGNAAVDTSMSRSGVANLQTNSGFQSTNATNGVGYATGAGGTVSQGTSRSTAVTLNKITGQVSTFAVALANGASVTFSVNNSTVTGNDVVIAASNGGSFVSNLQVSRVASGVFDVTYTNNSGGSDSLSRSINFVVLKGATS